MSSSEEQNVEATGCPACGGDGWYIDHEDECYETGDCNCSGVQRECECQSPRFDSPPASVPSPPEPARPPDSFWREVPCGHPQDPVAWRAPDGHFVCHCAWGLDATDAISDGSEEGASGPIVPCGKCGCYVALPREQSSPGQTG